MRHITVLAALLFFQTSALAGEGAPQVEPTEDGAVLSIVFESLVARRGPGLPLSLSRRAPRTVFVSMTPPSIEPSNFPWVLEKALKSIPQAIRPEATAAYEDSRRRVAARDAVFYRSSNPRVVVLPAARQSGVAEYGASYPVAPYPPGYSGTTAIVKLYFPELSHPSLAVYILRSQQHRWKVVSSRFVTLS